MHMSSDPASVDSGVHHSDSTSRDHQHNPRYTDKVPLVHCASASAGHRNNTTYGDDLRSVGRRSDQRKLANSNKVAPQHQSVTQGLRHNDSILCDDLFSPQYTKDTSANHRNDPISCGELRPVQGHSEVDARSDTFAPLQQDSAIQETRHNDSTPRDDLRPLENRTYAKSSRSAPSVPNPLTVLSEQDQLARSSRRTDSAAAKFALKRSINPSSVCRIDVENHMPAHRRPAVKYPGYGIAEVDRAIRKQRGFPDPTDGGSAARRQLEQLLAKRA